MLVVFMAVFMVIAATACGNNGGGSSNSVVGTWKLKIDSSKVPEEQKATAAILESALDVTLTFSEGGKVTVDMKMSLMGQESSAAQEGTWKQEGDKITISGTQSAGASVQTDGVAVLKDGKLYMEAETSNAEAAKALEYMYFEKQ